MLRRDSLACGTTQKCLFVERKMKKIKIIRVNPVAKAMLGNRKSPQVVPPKKGKKKPYKRTRFNVRSESYESEV
jgi:hypothetical protein